MAHAELLMPIGMRLKQLRAAKGITQLELSRATGLSLSIIAQLEQGETANPRLNTVKALAKGLGCTLDELAGEGDDQGRLSAEDAPSDGPPPEPPAPPKRPRKPKK
jgi:transcriptional regulator with XRE-family HTH domain